jgi:hypothetical protein
MLKSIEPGTTQHKAHTSLTTQNIKHSWADQGQSKCEISTSSENPTQMKGHLGRKTGNTIDHTRQHQKDLWLHHLKCSAVLEHITNQGPHIALSCCFFIDSG